MRRVRVMVFASGSRGDVQPLVALARGLQGAGHDVTLAAARDFADLVVGHGVRFHAMPVDVGEFLRSDLGKSWLGHSSHRPMLELKLLTEMVTATGVPLADEIAAFAGRADLFVSGVLTAEATRALVEAAGGRHVVALLAPFAPSRAGWAVLQAPRPGSVSRQNLWSSHVVNWFVAGAFAAVGKAVRRRLGQPPSSRRDFTRVFLETPTVVGVSPAVLPTPADWPAGHEVTGYWFLDAPEGWLPDASLTAFLAAGPPPVYLGFGSMSTHDADGTLDLMLAALAATGQRGIVHSGGAGLRRETLPADVLLVDDVPHEWLLPLCAAVVHHGGAGSTAAGLRAGVPSGVVAHIGDQPYWGRRLWELGVGAKPMRRHELSEARLAAMIRELTGSADLRARAADLGATIRAEDGVAVAVQAIERLPAG